MGSMTAKGVGRINPALPMAGAKNGLNAAIASPELDECPGPVVGLGVEAQPMDSFQPIDIEDFGAEGNAELNSLGDPVARVSQGR